MKTIYRGHEIDVRRERSMGGDDLLYYSIFRVSDGYECTSGFTSDSSTEAEYIWHMKDRIDNELSEADPWGEHADPWGEHDAAASASLTPPAPEASDTHERQLTQVIEERDLYHDWCDWLADAIAKRLGIEIGEHSSDNNPWGRALLALEEAAPVPSPEPRHATKENGDCPHWCKACATERATREAMAGPSPEPREPTPPSLPETVTDAQWMAEFEQLPERIGRMAEWLNSSACIDQTAPDEAPGPVSQFDYELTQGAQELWTIQQQVAEVLAHIGKRPAMSEDAKDAARYRWLKMQANPSDVYPLIERLAKVKAAYEVLTSSWTTWDAAIDAALSTAPAQPTGKTTDADGVTEDRNAS